MAKKLKVKKLLKTIKIFLYIIFLIVYYFAIFVNTKFGDISFEQILFNIVYSEGANLDLVYEGIVFVFLRVAIIVGIICLLYFLFKKMKLRTWIKFGINNKIKRIEIFKPTIITSILGLIIVGYYTLTNSYKILNLDEYIESQKLSSPFFEEYYVGGKEVEITFPKKKRNLIYIFVESMESTNVSIENGGVLETSYIPELEKLALENINFSNIDKDEPFNFTILTVDTHITDGYLDDTCEEKFNTKYANSLYCADQKINSFIKWIKEQDFYENTTIIISGDHLTMQSGFYSKEVEDKRTIYNAFINSPIEPKSEKNRLFSSFDMFPTTLAALGVNIEGDKLGLGVDLFSNKKTLIEELGIDYVNSEITKKSFYYDNVILGESYYEMEEEIKKGANK